MVMGLHRRRDVEVSRVGEQFDIVPLSPKGVRAMSEYLGGEIVPQVPVRMTDAQYTGFMAHIRQQTYGGFSLGAKRRFRGQRMPDASGLVRQPIASVA